MSILKMKSAFILLLFALLQGCASDSAIKSGTATAVTGTSAETLGRPDNLTQTGVYTGNSEYRIGPQDLLEVSVFLNQDLRREVRVNTGGQISLPLVGSVQAGGKTVQELEAELSAAYGKSYLQNPQINVFIKEFTSQRVTLEGNIAKPGIYPITGKTSLLQAIAIGGGMERIASESSVVVFRVVNGQRMAAVFDITQIRSGEAPDPEIFGDDIIVVDKSKVKSVYRAIIESLPIVNMFGIY
jgi:polysaccharide export outer membrane protein